VWSEVCTYTGLEMGGGGEAGVPLDVDGSRRVLSEQVDPLVGLVGGLAYGEDVLDQWSADLECVFDGVGVR
jgi:hypothetical protein